MAQQFGALLHIDWNNKMNIKTMSKYRRQLNWLLEDPDNRTLMIKARFTGYSDSSWSKDAEGAWNRLDEDIIEAVVINDENVEYRMAEVDGKIVQQTDDLGRWKDRHNFNGQRDKGYFPLQSRRYRMKPLKWHDDVSSDSPVLCKLWDYERPKLYTYDYVVRMDAARYVDASDRQWCHAEPITVADLLAFQRKGTYDIAEMRRLDKEYRPTQPEGTSYQFINWLNQKEIKAGIS